MLHPAAITLKPKHHSPNLPPILPLPLSQAMDPYGGPKSSKSHPSPSSGLELDELQDKELEGAASPRATSPVRAHLVHPLCPQLNMGKAGSGTWQLGGQSQAIVESLLGRVTGALSVRDVRQQRGRRGHSRR